MSAHGRALVAAMVPLAPGVSGDFVFVVVRNLAESITSIITAALVSLLFFCRLW